MQLLDCRRAVVIRMEPCLAALPAPTFVRCSLLPLYLANPRQQQPLLQLMKEMLTTQTRHQEAECTNLERPLDALRRCPMIIMKDLAVLLLITAVPPYLSGLEQDGVQMLEPVMGSGILAFVQDLVSFVELEIFTCAGKVCLKL